MTETYRDPDPDEWPSVVNTAKALLALDWKRSLGMVTGGPSVNVDRCQELLQRGELLGFKPCENAAEEFVRLYNSGESLPT